MLPAIKREVGMIFDKKLLWVLLIMFQSIVLEGMQPADPRTVGSVSPVSGSPVPSLDQPVIQTSQPGILESAFSKVKTTAHVVGSLGKASLNAPSIVKIAKEIKNVTAPAIKRNLHLLEKKSVKAMVTESNKIIFASFLVSNLMQTIFGSMVQSMDIGSIFTDTSEVSKSLGILFSQIITLNDLSGDMFSVLFSPETTVGLKEVSRLLSSFSVRLSRVTTYFTPSNRQQDFVEYMRFQLNHAVESSLENAKQLQAYLQQKVGTISLQELRAHFKDFVLFPDKGVRIKDFIESFYDLKTAFDQSGKEIERVYPKMNLFIESIGEQVEQFSERSLPGKLLNAPGLIKPLGENIEGVILVLALLIDQARIMTSSFLKTVATVEQQVSVSLVSRDLLLELKGLWHDIDLLRSALISVAVGLPSTDSHELIELRSQLNITTQPPRVPQGEGSQAIAPSVEQGLVEPVAPPRAIPQESSIPVVPSIPYERVTPSGP